MVHLSQLCDEKVEERPVYREMGGKKGLCIEEGPLITNHKHCVIRNEGGGARWGRTELIDLIDGQSWLPVLSLLSLTVYVARL